MRPHRRLALVAGIGLGLVAILTAVNIATVRSATNEIDTIESSLLPQARRLDVVSRNFGKVYAASKALGLSSSPEDLSVDQYQLVADLRNAETRANTAWHDYEAERARLPGEAKLRAQVAAAQRRFEDAQIPSAASTTSSGSTDTTGTEQDTSYTALRGALARLQSLVSDNIRATTGRSLDALRGELRVLYLGVPIATLLFVAVATVAFLTIRRREQRLAEQEQRHERETEHSVLERDLQRAMEFVADEEQSYEVVRVALQDNVQTFDVELLVADSSRAHFRRVAASDSVHGGCPVGGPRECPSTRRNQLMRFPQSAHLSACPYLRERPDPPPGAACVPVSISGRSIGVLHAMSKHPGAFDEDDIETLELVGRRIGDRLGTLRAFTRTEQQARTDPLTGLLNRRSIENEAQQLVRDGRDYIVAYGDIDHFKQLNDVHGHETGDRALRLFARVLRDAVRPTDLPARFGGEEFVVVLPDCTANEAVSVVERFRERLAIELADGRLPVFTVSFGVASASGVQFMDAVANADMALLRAKDAGRNRVVVESELTAPAPHDPTPEPAPQAS